MKKFFKKLWIKIFLKVHNRVIPPIEFEDNERTSASICRKLINHQDSKFLIAPLSQKRYIKNETLQSTVSNDSEIESYVRQQGRRSSIKI